MLLFAYLGSEPAKFQADRIDGKPIPPSTIVFLLLGCIAGIGIGYSSWWCRDNVSATSFTLIGVMNKCLTVLLNMAIGWLGHAAPGGIASLVLCLVGGAVYRQAPLRTFPTAASKAVAAAVDDVWESNESGHGREDEEEAKALVQPPQSDGGIKQRK